MDLNLSAEIDALKAFEKAIHNFKADKSERVIAHCNIAAGALQHARERLGHIVAALQDENPPPAPAAAAPAPEQAEEVEVKVHNDKPANN